MRNALLAAAASFVLAFGTMPTFAAEAGGGGKEQAQQGQQNDQSANVDNNCSEILANPGSHPQADVERCKSGK